MVSLDEYLRNTKIATVSVKLLVIYLVSVFGPNVAATFSTCFFQPFY